MLLTTGTLQRHFEGKEALVFPPHMGWLKVTSLHDNDSFMFINGLVDPGHLLIFYFHRSEDNVDGVSYKGLPFYKVDGRGERGEFSF